MGQRHALANFLVLCGPLAVGFVLVVLATSALAAPLGFAGFILGLYGAGLVLFLVAKASLFSRGIRVSVGSSQMSPWNRRAYRAGYALMIFGCVATLALLAALGGGLPS